MRRPARRSTTSCNRRGSNTAACASASKGTFTEQIVFPGALITYRSKTFPLQLLKTQLRAPDADMVNRSINNLEYELASAIRQVTARHKPKVAFLEGHGELDELQREGPHQRARANSTK